MAKYQDHPPVPMIPPDATVDEVFPTDMFTGLQPREQQAILYYLQSGNKTAAYTAAGYKNDSETLHNGGLQPSGQEFRITDNKHATRFFARPKIAEAVERAQALLTARAGVLTEDILAGLKTDAYGDMGELYRPGTFQLKPVSEWPEELRRSVQEVTIRTLPNGDVITTVKFPDRIKAKELLGKHKRLWEEKQSQGQGSTLIIQQVTVASSPPESPAAPPLPDAIELGGFRIQRPALPAPSRPPGAGQL